MRIGVTLRFVSFPKTEQRPKPKTIDDRCLSPTISPIEPGVELFVKLEEEANKDNVKRSGLQTIVLIICLKRCRAPRLC